MTTRFDLRDTAVVVEARPEGGPVDAPDFGHLEPMLDTTLETLQQHGVSE